MEVSYNKDNNSNQEIKCYTNFIGCIELNKIGDLLAITPIDVK